MCSARRSQSRIAADVAALGGATAVHVAFNRAAVDEECVLRGGSRTGLNLTAYDVTPYLGILLDGDGVAADVAALGGATAVHVAFNGAVADEKCVLRGGARAGEECVLRGGAGLNLTAYDVTLYLGILFDGDGVAADVAALGGAAAAHAASNGAVADEKCVLRGGAGLNLTAYDVTLYLGILFDGDGVAADVAALGGGEALPEPDSKYPPMISPCTCPPPITAMVL